MASESMLIVFCVASENDVPTSVPAENYAYDVFSSSHSPVLPYHLITDHEQGLISDTGNGWQYQSELDLSSLPFSPASDLPCPRISRPVPSAASSQTFAYAQAPQRGRSEGLVYDCNLPYSHYSLPLPQYTSTVASSSPGHSWMGLVGASDQSGAGVNVSGNYSYSLAQGTGRSSFDSFEDPSVKGSGYNVSRPVSPQSSFLYSDSVEYTRPKQKRKVTLDAQRQNGQGEHESSTPFSSTGMSSDFLTSDTGNASDSSFIAAPSRKGRASKRETGKRDKRPRVRPSTPRVSGFPKSNLFAEVDAVGGHHNVYGQSHFGLCFSLIRGDIYVYR